MLRVNTVEPCAVCARPTRPARTLLADHPGTTQRHVDMCRRCYWANSGTQPITHAAHENNCAGLRSFLARRRDRENAMLRRTYYEERMSAA